MQIHHTIKSKILCKQFLWCSYVTYTHFRAKRSVLHISEECLVHYSIGMAFTPESIYKSVIDMGILRAVQSGFLIKMTHDIEWQIMRSATGKLLQVI